jgi:predicted secreted acid phosphatase
MADSGEEERFLYRHPTYDALHGLVQEIFSKSVPGDFVVFDIDDTVLRGSGRFTTPHEIGMEVLRTAKNNSIPVYYVTARMEFPENRLNTIEDLARVGIVSPQTVFMRPPWINTWRDISENKAACRRLIETKTDGNCLMSVGDQWTDLLVVSEEGRNKLDADFGPNYVLFQYMSGRKWGLKLKDSQQ